MIKKYTEQQKNVRNNREFNSLSKEVEFQELEIQLADKHIKEFSAQIEQKNEVINGTKERLQERETHLKHKKADLNDILAETEKEDSIDVSDLGPGIYFIQFLSTYTGAVSRQKIVKHQ